ncbi:hypothetical protein [Psychrobacter sp. AOP1-A1-60]|uniref:hypothetical protein n=1 Tax=Psychrobacter sp. AOP1-A1-60 TaxID=3457727 RepID=UPI0040373E8E
MSSFKKMILITMLTPLFIACSDGPSESTVEGLIEAQYEQANSMMNGAMTSDGNDEMVKALSGMMENIIPKLESIENISCDTTEGENTYMCVADITQTVGGNSTTNKASFKVHQVNNEWVLGD